MPVMEDRKMFLGGSDIAAVMGMSRWKTPLQLWGEKTGVVAPADLSNNEAVELGLELEEFVANKFRRKTGMKVRKPPIRHYISRDYPFMACQVDRLIEGTEELLECKTASLRKEKEWDGDSIPEEYILQVLWQLMITGRKTGWIAVLIGGQKFLYKRINADEEMFALMTAAALKFWEMVHSNTPPMAVADDNESIVDLYPKHDDQIQALDEFDGKIKLLQELKMHIAELDDQKDGIEAAIKQVIGDNVGIKTTHYTVTWKGQITKRLDAQRFKADHPDMWITYAKESFTRVMRVNKNKEE